MMSYKAGYDQLKFERLEEKVWEEYILAIHKAADKDYSAMEEIIKFIF